MLKREDMETSFVSHQTRIVKAALPARATYSFRPSLLSFFVVSDSSHIVSVRAAVISDAEWERHRATIEALYAEHRLDTVVRQLREKYNFDATEKQYKRRLAKWNVAKNVKSCEVLRLIDEPAAPRTIRGQWVSEVKIKRHRRRLRGRLSVAWNSTENSAQQSEARLQQCRVPGDTEDHSSHSPSQAFSVQVDPRNDKGFGDGVKSSIEDDHADKPEPTTLASLGLPTRGVPVAAVGSQALRPNSVQSEGQIYDPAVVKIALLQNMLFLNKNHFERNLSEEAFTADVRAVNLRNLDVAQRIDLHRLFPSLSEREVFIAAYLLYRRRGIFLLTSRGTTTTENVLAAVCLARPGDLIHHLSSDFGPGRNARILMQEETKLPKLHDPTAWQKWFSLMSTILKDIFEHLPNRDCWQPQRTSSSLETAVSEQHLAAHNLMQLRRIVLPPISSRGIGYQLDEPGTMIPVEDWELSTVFDGKFDENKRVYIIG